MTGLRRAALLLAPLICAPAIALAQQPAETPPTGTEPEQSAEPAAPSASASSPAPDYSNLSGPGESCRARKDCQPGLLCRDLRCVDEHEGETCNATRDCGRLRCVHHRCVTPGQSAPAERETHESARPAGEVKEQPPDTTVAGEGSARSKVRFEVGQGVHPFIGISVGVGPVVIGPDLADVGLQTYGPEGAFAFALRGGVLADHHELALEISPFTYAYAFVSGVGPTFRASLSYAYHVPLLHGQSLSIFYPPRLGLGFFTGNTFDNTWLEIRLDAVGLALSAGHFLIEAYLPSFRLAAPPAQGTTALPYFFTFLFGANVSYVF